MNRGGTRPPGLPLAHGRLNRTNNPSCSEPMRLVITQSPYEPTGLYSWHLCYGPEGIDEVFGKASTLEGVIKDAKQAMEAISACYAEALIQPSEGCTPPEPVLQDTQPRFTRFLKWLTRSLLLICVNTYSHVTRRINSK